MKRIISIGVLSAALAFGGAQKSEAAFITGQLDIASAARFVNGLTGAPSVIGAATGIDFGAASSPGVPGTFLVVSATGSFAAAGMVAFPNPGFTTGSIYDFTFAGAGSASYPVPPLTPFQLIGAPAFTFNMNSVFVIVQTANALALLGTGTMSLAGYDDTPGLFAFTTQDPTGTSTGTFSFSATDVPVPEPGSMLLLGTGLLGLAAAARRRARKV